MKDTRPRAGNPPSRWKQVDWERAILAGFVCNLASFAVGGGLYLVIFSIFSPELEGPFAAVLRWTPARAFEMPLWWWLLLAAGNTALAMGVAVVYAVLYPGLPGRGVWKGVWFGFLL